MAAQKLMSQAQRQPCLDLLQGSSQSGGLESKRDLEAR